MQITVCRNTNAPSIDNKPSVQQSTDNYYFLQDHLGSTTALTDSSGNINEQTSYDSFGNAMSPLSTRYQFTSREFDDLTALYLYQARWYDAKTGRNSRRKIGNVCGETLILLFLFFLV